MSQRTDYDVVVVGAGTAGVAAAVAAAEEGARTLLVERGGGVGGTLVWQLLEHSAGFHDVDGTQVVSGVGQRIVDLLAHYGGTPGHIGDDVGYTATRTPVNHAELAMAESVMLAEAGVTFWPYAAVVATAVDSGRIRELAVESPAGRRRLGVRAVVDASGDAVVAAQAGAGFQSDATGSIQPASLLLKVAGFDFGPLLELARTHPEVLREGNKVGTANDDHINLWGFRALLDDAHRRGILSWRRTEMHLAGWPTRGECVVNLTRTTSPSDADPGDHGATYLTLARQALEAARFFRECVPGGERSYIAAVADRVGVRESRRVLGVETLTHEDVIGGRQRSDAVAQGAFPIDIHDASAPGLSHTDAPRAAYQIPFGALVVAGLDNLLAAGRIVSSTHEANGSVRITATCFATGEAAGVTAAVVAADGDAARQVSVARVQDILRRRGALIGN